MKGGWKAGTFQPPQEDFRKSTLLNKAKICKYPSPYRDFLQRWLERSSLPATFSMLWTTPRAHQQHSTPKGTT